MLCPPRTTTADEVAAAVTRHWLPEVTTIDHLPVGFGAHHWRVTGGDTTLFVTLDQLAPRHTAASLEAAYAGAAALAAAVPAVWPGLPAYDGRFTVPHGHGVLSATPWLIGHTPTEAEATKPGHLAEVLAALAELHRAEPPDLPRWTPRVGRDFADQVRAWTATTGEPGPCTAPARTAVAARLDAITHWTRRYRELAGLAHERGWVPTHGEPHHANQMTTEHGLRLVDWETLALAPRERDLLACGAGGHPEADPAMVELFELDWRLSEIDEYTRWFGAPHTGDAQDQVALEGLLAELG